MDRIDSGSATSDRKFTEGNVVNGTPATTVAADWLNDVQENLCLLVTGSGQSLIKGDYTQVLKAVQALAAASITGLRGANGYLRVPYTDTGGTKRSILLQWGSVSVMVPNAVGSTVTQPFSFPISFVNQLFAMASSNNNTVAGSDPTDASEVNSGFRDRTLTGATAQATRVAGSQSGAETVTINYFAIGE